MPNTISVKKSLRSSNAKKGYNFFWKHKIKTAIKSLKAVLTGKNEDKELTAKELSILQKMLDKAAKNKVIHKNKANRLKSKYAHKIAAITGLDKTKAVKATKSKSAKSKSSK